MVSKHILIKGRVQGVFFRVTAKEIADELSVKGWVRNTDEGDVEALAIGYNEDVEKFIDWCRRGPRKAVVSEVIVKDSEENNFTEFSIKR